MYGMMQTNKVFLCACASRTFIDKEKVAQLAAILQAAGKEVELVPDLCEWIENRSEHLSSITGNCVVACHLRAIKALFEWAEQPVPTTLDLRTNDVATLLPALGLPTDSEAPAESASSFQKLLEGFEKKTGTDAWFPTIDKSRCIDCGKCHDFCLFGVYTLVEGKKVTVKAPHNCKNNCPACARGCPTGAIIFPKYEQAPINGGEAKGSAALKIDTGAMYNQALRERLAARRAGVSLLRNKPQS